MIYNLSTYSTKTMLKMNRKVKHTEKRKELIYQPNTSNFGQTFGQILDKCDQIFVQNSKYKQPLKPVTEQLAGAFFECLLGVPF